MDRSRLAQDGYLVTSPLLSASECQALDANLSSVAVAMAGNRSLLEADWCRALAGRLKQQPALARLLPRDARAVQCTLFEKSVERNWLVALHQDLSIPVAAKVDHPALSGWSSKEAVCLCSHRLRSCARWWRCVCTSMTAAARMARSRWSLVPTRMGASVRRLP